MRLYWFQKKYKTLIIRYLVSIITLLYFFVVVPNHLQAAAKKAEPDKFKTTLQTPLAAVILPEDITHVACHDEHTGRARVTPSGGTPPYSYLWSTNPTQITQEAVNLGAGSYFVSVIDQTGVSVDAFVTITEAPQLYAAISSTTVVHLRCYGEPTGQAEVNGTGGIPPYTYLWDDTHAQTTALATGLPVGFFTAIITDNNGCEAFAQVAINGPPVPLGAEIFEFNTQHVNCFGENNGAAEVTAIDGEAPFSYHWDTDPVQTNALAINLLSGIYTATVTDNNSCTATVSVQITQPTQVHADIPPENVFHVNCFGDNTAWAEVNATGGISIYSYQWNDPGGQVTKKASTLTAGTYQVLVTDAHDCEASATVTITEPAAALSAEILAENVHHVNCFDGSDGSAQVDVSGGTMPYTYEWSDANNQTTATATGLRSGTYQVMVRDSKFCSVQRMVTITEPIDPVSSIIHAAGVGDLRCYGVPEGFATVMPDGGTPPYSYLWSSTPAQTTATATGLYAGTYIVQVFDSKACEASSQVVIYQPANLQAAILEASVTHVHCLGDNTGSALVQASGGVEPYSYQWNDSENQTTSYASNLLAGSYSVSITDANFCEASATVQITQPNSAISISLDNAATRHVSCFAGRNGSATVQAFGGTPPHSYSWDDSSAQASAQANYLFAGTYTCTVTDAHDCPSASIAVTIQQPENELVADVLSEDVIDVLCAGENTGAATVTASGGTPPYTYQWNDPSSQTTMTATALPRGFYDVIVSDANNCTATDLVSINQPLFKLAARVEHYNIQHVNCFGESTAYAIPTITGGTRPYRYLWSSTPVQTSETVTGLAAGTYTLQVFDNQNCTAETNLVITQPDTPLSSEIIPESVVHIKCYGDARGAAKVRAWGGTPPYDYEWNDTYNQASASIILLPAGIYTATASDGKNCKSYSTIEILQPDELKVDNVQVNNVSTCYGSNEGTITITASGGVPPYQYSIDEGAHFQASNIFTGLLLGTYPILVKDANKCHTEGSPVSLIGPQPIEINRQFFHISCHGYDDGRIRIEADGGTGRLTYSIDGGVNFYSNGGEFTELQPGDYQIVVKDGNGCLEDGGVLSLNEPKGVSFDSELIQNGCHDVDNGKIVLAASGGIGTLQFKLNDGAYQANGIFKNLASGIYVVTVKDGNGCLSTSTTYTIVNPPSQANFTADVQSGCSPLEVQFTNIYDGAISYIWQFGDESGTIQKSPKHSFINTQVDDIIYHIKAFAHTASCFDTAHYEITVHSSPTADFTVTPEEQLYPEKTITIQNNSSQGYDNYLWDFGDGNTRLDTEFIESFIYTYDTYGDYTVELLIFSANCSDTARFTHHILPRPPVPKFSFNKEGCAPWEVFFENASEYSYSYFWSFGDLFTSTEENPSHIYNEPGKYEVCLTAYGAENVADTHCDTVTVFEVPDVFFEVAPDTIMIPGQAIRCFNQTEKADNYFWDLGDGTLSEEFSPFYYYQKAGNYDVKLLATTDEGCKDSLIIHSAVVAEDAGYIFFPSAFTPNYLDSKGGVYDPEDDSNDIFHPVYAGIVAYHLAIFNRWGEIIFETTDPTIGWDGYYSNGSLARQDVYVWRSKGKFNNGEQFRLAGDLTLIR